MTTARTAPSPSPLGTTAPAPAVSARTGRRRTSILRGLAGVAALIATLEVLSRLNLVNPAFLPPFSEVAARLFGALAEPQLWLHVASTLAAWLIGMLVSAVVAVPLGIVLGLSEVGYQVSRSIVEFARTMPAIALIPLVLLVIGPGLEMKVVVAVYAAVWPILFNTIYGVHDVDPSTRDMARIFGQTRFQIIRRIVLPSAAPLIATGIRISSAIVLIVVITVELVAGGADGVGAFIASNRAQGNQVALVYAGILLTGILGLVINLALGALERRLFGWSTQENGK
ncbi:ABC transporter permease [Microbacterium allomyrinae]|uniref:ABC transporter permease n=1 Tax=Microbacterium allomyrinae TaxID=2830666 RepID=A0A9X1LW44_9MICO|nr:ABC transporter permease [Microbacterium allomyrinae]MCC2033175.1 ABC transporter permease [Microbacterium allomyrinae]